jgi:hypothetical protein
MKIFRVFSVLVTLVSGWIFAGLYFFAYDDRSAEVAEIVQLLRFDGYTKDTIELDSSLARLALKRKKLAQNLLDVSQLQTKRRKDLTASQKEMFAEIAKTEYDKEEVRKQFESGKTFRMTEPLGKAYHQWKAAQAAVKEIARLNSWIDLQESHNPIYEFTAKITTTIYRMESEELLQISPEEQREIDVLLASKNTELDQTSEILTDPKEIYDLVWSQTGEYNNVLDKSDNRRNNVKMDLLEQYTGKSNRAEKSSESSDSPVVKYLVRPKWFKKALVTDCFVFAVCFPIFLQGFNTARRKRAADRKARDKQTQIELDTKTKAAVKRTTELEEEKARLELERKKQEEENKSKLNGKMIDALLELFSDSENYHQSVNPLVYDLLKHGREQLARTLSTADYNTSCQNIPAILPFITKLQQHWEQYYRHRDNIRLIEFWRPDSWDRFENKFPNQRLTEELRKFNL